MEERRPKVEHPVEEQGDVRPSRTAEEPRESNEPLRERTAEDAGETGGIGYTEEGKKDDRLDRI